MPNHSPPQYPAIKYPCFNYLIYQYKVSPMHDLLPMEILMLIGYLLMVKVEIKPTQYVYA